MSIQYFDSHCHLGDDAYLEDLEQVISTASNEGLTRMLTLGWDLKSSKKAVELAHRFELVYAAVGFHPENLEEVSDEALEEIKVLAQDPKVIAIGEIGLDYYWYKDPKDHEKQKVWLIKQIDLANELGLPVSIHAREASFDILQLLTEHPVKNNAVLHCYSGSVESLKSLAKLGYYFGFDGPITYKNAIVPKECVKACPIDRLLVETDSPYLSPVPLRGTRNEPKNIPIIVKTMAELRDLSIEEMTDVLNDNFRHLFHV